MKIFKRQILAGTAVATTLSALAMPTFAVEIDDDLTAPVSTSTANNGQADNITLTDESSIELDDNRTAITLDSNNSVTLEGSVLYEGIDNATAVEIKGGYTGDFTITEGSITVIDDDLDEDYETNPDDDYDEDTPFSFGSNRYGVRITGTAPYTGNFLLDDGSITVQGSNSTAFSLETPMVGDLTLSGTVSATGVSDVIAVDLQEDITGDVRIEGSVSATGANSQGLVVDGDVSGSFVIQGSITSTGYRYTSAPSEEEDLDDLDENDLAQGGTTVTVRGNLAQGLYLDAAPEADEDDADEDQDGDGIADDEDDDNDNDGVEDSEEGTSYIASFSGSPAMDIGGTASAPLTFGNVGTGDLAYGLVNKGTVAAYGVYEGIPATGITTSYIDLSGGVRNEGSITVSATEADAVALDLGVETSATEIYNEGSIDSSIISEGENSSIAVDIDASASVTSIVNEGTGALIYSSVTGERGESIALNVQSPDIRSIDNTGTIAAVQTSNDDVDDTDDADTDEDNEVVTTKIVAIDVSNASGGVTVTQSAPTIDEDDKVDEDDLTDDNGDGLDDGTEEPAIIGDVLFGAYDDTFTMSSGDYSDGTIYFGAGADTLTISGKSKYEGGINDSDGRLDITVDDATLELTEVGQINATSLTTRNNANLTFMIDTSSTSATNFNLTGAATLETGTQIKITTEGGLLRGSRTYTLINAGTLTSGTDVLTSDNIITSYMLDPTVITTGTSLAVDLRLKTAEEMEMNANQTRAYEPVLDALDIDDELADAVMAQTTKETFFGAYDQLLPEYNGLMTKLMALGSRTAARTAFDRMRVPQRFTPQGGWWASEIGGYQKQSDRANTPGYEGFNIGANFGYEAPALGLDSLGLGITAMFSQGQDGNDSRKRYSATTGELNAFAGQRFGPVSVFARVAAGVSSHTSRRRVEIRAEDEEEGDDPLFEESSKASWQSYHLAGNIAANANFMIGNFQLQPEAGFDYFRMTEGSREEEGGGDSLDLAIDGRTTSQAEVWGSMRFGYWFQTKQDRFTNSSTRIGPFVKIGVRQPVMAKQYETTARYRYGGDSFTLIADKDEGMSTTAAIGVQGMGDIDLLTVVLSGEHRGDNTTVTGRVGYQVKF